MKSHTHSYYRQNKTLTTTTATSNITMKIAFHKVMLCSGKKQD
jgi:hypothetical protein